MSEVQTRPDLGSLVDRHHQLAARVTAAEASCRAAQAAADAADQAAGDAVVGGDADTMRQADDAADLARATLARARRDHAALQRAHDALRPEIQEAIAAIRQAMLTEGGELLADADRRFRAAMLKAHAAHTEAVAIAFASDHPFKETLPLLRLPSSMEFGTPMLDAAAPHQPPPELPRGALALVDMAALLRDADRVVHPVVIAL